MLGFVACAGLGAKPDADPAPAAFYTVTGEIALARHEPRVAALQYAGAAATGTDPALIERATQVAFATLQPSLADRDAARWIRVDPASVEAQRAAARAELALHQIEPAAAHYRHVLLASPAGLDAEFATIELELARSENLFGARQVADRLAASFPGSAAGLRLQGFAALRADDPAAAVRGFTSYLLRASELSPSADKRSQAARREVLQALARARILSGDVEAPLARARATVAGTGSADDRLDYVQLLMTAQRDSAANQELEILVRDPEFAPAAVRLLGLLALQQGHLDAAAARFAELQRMEKYREDAFFYLAVIAERQGDVERALRLYAQVQSGENTLAALLRATALLHKHGAQAAAEELLDRLLEDEPLRAAEILSVRARLYADGGDLPQALRVLQRGVMEYPDSVELRYSIASTYEEQGNVAATLNGLNELLKARPDDPAALNALGYTLADHGRHLRRARQLIDRAYALAPGNAAVLDSLGWVMFRQGNAAEAETYLRKAYADDRGGDIAAHLGEVMWHLGDATEAERIWTDGSSADADNRLLRETRQRLHAQTPAAN